MMMYTILFVSIFLLGHDEANYSYIDTSWKQSITTDLLRQYQAPNTVMQLLKQSNANFAQDRSIMDLQEFYLKRDISRIIGHLRLKQLFTQEQCNAFDVPTKYVVPYFDKNGVFDFEQSYVISMLVSGDCVRFWDHAEVEKLLHFGQETGVVDFYYSNIKRDNNGKNWFIDTQVEKTNEGRRYRAAQQLLQNLAWRVLDYTLESRTIDYLNDIVFNYIGL